GSAAVVTAKLRLPASESYSPVAPRTFASAGTSRFRAPTYSPIFVSAKAAPANARNATAAMNRVSGKRRRRGSGARGRGVVDMRPEATGEIKSRQAPPAAAASAADA